VSKSSTLFYDRNAAWLVRRYESLTFEQVHHSILDLIPLPPAFVLDAGAGSGRDAAALGSRRLKVYAVEPSKAIRSRAQRIHPNINIKWIDDKLPYLRSVRRLGRRFRLILVSAVWMHLASRERRPALRTLARLLSDSGYLVITLRHGRIDPVRRFFLTSTDELVHLGDECALELVRVTKHQPDQLARGAIEWQTVVFRRSA